MNLLAQLIDLVGESIWTALIWAGLVGPALGAVVYWIAGGRRVAFGGSLAALYAAFGGLFVLARCGYGPAWGGYLLLTLPMLGIGLGFALVIAGMNAARFHLRHPPLLIVQCAQCGCDLAGNVSGVCPECGMPIPR